MPAMLRPYGPDDAPAVLALNQSHLDAVGPLDTERLPWLVGLCDHVLVVDDAGEVAGFAFVLGPGTSYDSVNYGWFAQRYASFGYLDRIVVAPTHRRQGIGGLLYDEAERVSAPSGRLLCEVYVEPPNVASLAFHDARGYREVGRLPQANGKTCTMLEKTLA